MLAVVIPGFLIAATGVGAGDLATAGFAGIKLGTAVLWAIVVGAALKFVLTEGLTRWQLTTGQTLLEGAVDKLGRPVSLLFAIYLVPWSFFVGAALISACGVTASAIVPVADDPQLSKLIFGVLHSVAGIALVWFGGYRVFEKIMMVCVGVMFAAVLATAIMIAPQWDDVLRGLVVPAIPLLETGGLTWTIALTGGVGGTVTILCYGYWIRERGRTGALDLSVCRIDLGVGYLATALFGIAMLIIAASARSETFDVKGAGLIVALGDQLRETLGPAGQWIFLIGAWAAVFSSLLGVWQAVPYLFADFWRLQPWRSRRAIESSRAHIDRAPVDTQGRAYRSYLLAIGLVPLIQLQVSFEQAQKLYAVMGAFFLPMLALVLLIMNSRAKWIGAAHRNRIWTQIVLMATLLFFALAGYWSLAS